MIANHHYLSTCFDVWAMERQAARPWAYIEATHAGTDLIEFRVSDPVHDSETRHQLDQVRVKPTYYPIGLGDPNRKIRHAQRRAGGSEPRGRQAG